MANDVLTAAKPGCRDCFRQAARCRDQRHPRLQGYPYGASADGANRFLPPQPAAPWTGTRDALAYRGQATIAGAGKAPC